MSRMVSTFAATLCLVVLSAGCTDVLGALANGSNVAAKPQPAGGSAVAASPLPSAKPSATTGGGPVVAVLPNGAVLKGGELTEAQVDAFEACLKGKSTGTTLEAATARSVLSLLGDWRAANSIQRGLGEKVILKYMKELGCL